jgi:hypothetical protein
VEADHNREIVRSKINGEDVYLLVDSGTERTCLTHDCAKDLKLDVHQTNKSNVGVGGVVNGKIGEALIKSFTLNGYEINRLNPLNVLPPQIRGNMAKGILGADCLHLNAVLMPVGASLMLFKPGNAAAPAINPYMAQLGYNSVALSKGKGGLHAKAELNGHPVDMLIDSGSTFSFFDIDLVRKISKSTIWTTRLATVGLDQNRQLDYAFTPSQFTVGSIQMTPEMLCAGKAPGFKYPGIDALFGFDLLSEHHAIIDFGHDVLWMKP